MLFVLLLSCVCAAQEPAVVSALANDNRTSGGALRDGELTIHLEIRKAVWCPQQEGGPYLTVYTFAEEGRAPQVPGPLIRVPEGTTVHAFVRNHLALPMFVFGLHTRPGPQPPLEIAPGAVREVRFASGAPGTYFYEAKSTKQNTAQLAAITLLTPLDNEAPQYGKESQLTGVFVVDPAGHTADDRIFVISIWLTGLAQGPFREVLAINGKGWPFTERLTYRQGDHIRWRWVNASASDHAMHLHGFFYRLNSVGDANRDEIFPEEKRPQTVTQHMVSGGTMSLEWAPDRAGRWIFHCHMTGHMSDKQDLAAYPLDRKEGAPPGQHVAGTAGMGGLVMGITVLPGVDAAKIIPPPEQPVRRLRLLVEPRPASEVLQAGLGYKIQESDAEPAGAPPVPGAPLVLTRGQPVEITVVNKLAEPTAVHWHGIELESYYDGVPMWGGDAAQMTPEIPPGGSFVARFTPPRAGTFIYHTHWHDVAQLSGGLYGPLIVLEPGEKFDPGRDRVFIISRAGPDESLILLNGSPQPGAIALKAGTRYRFRFINIATNDSDAAVSLRRDGTPVTWRAVGKDGAELPPAQAVSEPAEQTVTVGETYDFEYTPERPGDLTLEVWLPFLKVKLTQVFEVQP